MNNTGDKPRLRAPAFTDKEDEALIKTYFKYRNIIRGKNATGVSQKTRNDAWECVAKAVNAVDSRFNRTVKSVKIHYGNMLAEYKAFKANDKNSRTFQNNQVFYKYFDDLLTEKERMGGIDINNDDQDYLTEPFDDDGLCYTTDNDQSTIDSAQQFTQLAARFNELDEASSIMHECGIENNTLSQLLRFQSNMKLEPLNTENFTRDKTYLMNGICNNGDFSANCVANLNNESVNTTTELEKDVHCKSFLNMHKKVANRKIVTLKIKIMERQLEVLEKKCTMLQKQTELLNLQISINKRELTEPISKKLCLATSPNTSVPNNLSKNHVDK